MLSVYRPGGRFIGECESLVESAVTKWLRYCLLFACSSFGALAVHDRDRGLDLSSVGFVPRMIWVLALVGRLERSVDMATLSEFLIL
ncbi:hypothetical protein ACFX12_009603 [Malus domestica]